MSLISHANKVILKILQARLQQYMNQEIPDVQAEIRKGKGTRDQIANIHWIIEKAREFQKNIYFCFIDYTKAFDCVDHNKLENSSSDGNIRPPSVYSCHLLISSASVRSLPFLSFIVPIVVWKVLFVSLIFLKGYLVFPILSFSSIKEKS